MDSPPGFVPSDEPKAGLAEWLEPIVHHQKLQVARIEDLMAAQEQRIVDAIGALLKANFKARSSTKSVEPTPSQPQKQTTFNGSCDDVVSVKSNSCEVVPVDLPPDQYAARMLQGAPTHDMFGVTPVAPLQSVESGRTLSAKTDREKADDEDHAQRVKSVPNVVRQSFCNPELLEILQPSSWSHRILHHPFFESVSSILIVISSIMVGAEAGWRMDNVGEELPLAFHVTEWGCNACFTLELLLRMFCEGRLFLSRFNRNITWNLFDTVIVLAPYASELMQNLTDPPNVSVLRLIRILRLVRVFRLLRVLRFFSTLRTMIGGVMASAKLLMWALFLLGAIMYVFAVCILQFIAEEIGSMSADEASHLRKYYDGLLRTIYTLFLSISGGMDWGSATEPLLAVSPAFIGLYSIYISFVIFCVLNIVTGIFVENANKLIASDEERMVMEDAEKRKRWINEVQVIFSESDTDKSGEITYEEFDAMLSDARMQAYLHKLGVDWELYSTLGLFEQLDYDGSGTISKTEFFLAMQNLHGPARSIDMNHMKYSLRTLARKLDSLEAHLTDGMIE